MLQFTGTEFGMPDGLFHDVGSDVGSEVSRVGRNVGLVVGRCVMGNSYSMDGGNVGYSYSGRI